MGASISEGRRSVKGRHRPMAEINVTPFVDVMLVLLVVFMVTAPLLTVGVPVDLRAITGEAPDKRIFVRGDQSISYGRVMEVMGLINGAGFRRVALVAQQPRSVTRN